MQSKRRCFQGEISIMCGFLRLIFDVNEMNPAIKIEIFAVFSDNIKKVATFENLDVSLPSQSPLQVTAPPEGEPFQMTQMT